MRIIWFPFEVRYETPYHSSESLFLISEICLYKGSCIAHMVFNKVNGTFIYVSWSQAVWQSYCWRWLQWSKMPLIKTIQVRIWCQLKYCSVARFSASRLKLERTESNRMEKQDRKNVTKWNTFPLTLILSSIKNLKIQKVVSVKNFKHINQKSFTHINQKRLYDGNLLCFRYQ